MVAFSACGLAWTVYAEIWSQSDRSKLYTYMDSLLLFYKSYYRIWKYQRHSPLVDISLHTLKILLHLDRSRLETFAENQLDEQEDKWMSWNVLLHVVFGRPLLRVPPAGVHLIVVLECRWLGTEDVGCDLPDGIYALLLCFVVVCRAAVG